MSKEIEPAQKRIVRSDFELGQQCPIFWICSLGAVLIIHSDPPLFVSHVIVGNVLIALGAPIVFFVVLKLLRSVKYLMLNRSKKYDFVDDIKDPTLRQKRPPAVAVFRFENAKTSELSGTRGDLILSLAFYFLVVSISFAYQSSVYFYVALTVSAGIIASAIFCFVREMSSRGSEKGHSSSQLSNDNDEQTKDSEDQGSFIFWNVGSNNVQVRFSRVWLTEQLLNLGMWVALIVVIPLIGQLFSEMFWIAIGVGVTCLFVLEMCSMFVFGYAGKHLLGHK